MPTYKLHFDDAPKEKEKKEERNYNEISIHCYFICAHGLMGAELGKQQKMTTKKNNHQRQKKMGKENREKMRDGIKTQKKISKEKKTKKYQMNEIEQKWKRTKKKKEERSKKRNPDYKKPKLMYKF